MSSDQKFRIKSVLAQAVKPSRLLTMLGKVGKRVFDKKGDLDRSQNMKWIEAVTSDFGDLANRLDRNLWEESKKAAKNIEQRAQAELSAIEHNLGGGGAYPILYFIVRYMNPEYVVETGVAAGYSSYSILSAMESNDRGVLLSSDFPYFRLPNPEKYIGIVVPEELKTRWELLVEGDRVNLPKILRKIDYIDVFHYDSDKSYSGRRYATNLIADALSERGVILMDDIQDNSFFHDLIEESKPESWFIFEFQGKYVGMIGMPTRRAS